MSARVQAGRPALLWKLRRGPGILSASGMCSLDNASYAYDSQHCLPAGETVPMDVHALSSCEEKAA